MKYLKTFSLAALAASLLALCIAGSASATVITGEGGEVLPAGSFSESVNQGNIVLDAAIGTLECKKSTFGGKSTNAGGSTETVKGNVEIFTFSECNTSKLTVLTKGTTEAHTSEGAANNNGLVTSTGAEITVEFNGFHCIFKTNNTAFGTETGSANTGGASVIDLASTVPRSGGRSGAFCGTTGTLTGTYKNVAPGIVNVD